MKTIYSFILIILSIGFMQAQVAGIDISKEMEIPHNSLFGTFFFGNESELYFARAILKPSLGQSGWNQQYDIEIYGDDLKLKKHASFAFEIEKQLLTLDFPFFWNERLWISGAHYDPKGNIKTCYLFEIDPVSLKQIGKPHKLLSFEGYALEEYGSFNINRNNESLIVMGVPNSGNPTGATTVKKDKETAVLPLAVFDMDLNLVWDTDVSMNSSFNQYRLSSYELFDEENILCIGTSKEGSADYVITIVQDKGGSTKIIDLGLKEGYMGSWDNFIENNIATYIGFSSSKKFGDFDGVYSIQIDLTTGKTIQEWNTPLEISWLDEKGNVVPPIKLISYSLDYKGCRKLDDNTYLLTAELFKGDGGNVLEYKDILLIWMNGNGEIIKQMTIPKEQVFSSYNLGSYNLLEYEDQLSLFYNDNPDNLISGYKNKTATAKDCVLVKTVVKDYQVEGSEIIYTPGKDNYLISPTAFWLFDMNTFVFYSEKRTNATYKLIKVTFEE